MEIGERLRKIRTQQKLTARELAEASGVPEKTIYRIETGEVKDPRLSTLEPLIRSLNCSADELLFDRDKFTALAAIRQDFAAANELPEDELYVFQTMVRRFMLGEAIEKHIGEQLRQGKAVRVADEPALPEPPHPPELRPEDPTKHP